MPLRNRVDRGSYKFMRGIPRVERLLTSKVVETEKEP